MINQKELNWFQERKGTLFCSIAFILSYMFYVILISMLINFVLEPVLEPLYYSFQNTNPFWDIEFWFGTISITFTQYLIW